MYSVFSKLFPRFRRRPAFSAADGGKRPIKALIVLTTGWLFILVGAAGLVLPVVPGTILLLAGVMLLSRHYSWARRLLAAGRKRYPQVWRSLRDYRARLERCWIRVKEKVRPKKHTGAGDVIR